jgi:hypothetical protein
MAGFWESGTDKPHTQADVDAQLGLAKQARNNIAMGRADSIGSGIGMVAQALAGRKAMNNAADWAQGLRQQTGAALTPGELAMIARPHTGAAISQQELEALGSSRPPMPAPSPMPSYAPPSVPMPGMQAAMAAPAAAPAQGMMPNHSMFARMAGGR